MPVKIDEADHADDIVISGISGLFPASENVKEFEENLMQGRDMVSTVPKWDRPEAMARMGAIKNADDFDHDFFHMDRQQVENITTGTRLLLERVFETIMDAGYNLKQIKGRKLAVVCAVFDDFMKEKVLKDEKGRKNCGKSKLHSSNVISHWFDLKGPSITLDSACSTSFYAIDYAIETLQNGDCEGALVCSSNICTVPPDDYFNMGILSKTGQCRPFDAEGDGFTRAESAIVIFLQKRKTARRIYANVIHSKLNCDGFKAEGISYPSVNLQKQLYENFYKEINVNPELISFLETHGTGTQVGDLVEGTSVEEFFCAHRENPLKIGSVKSNMGHGEGSAGLCSLAKMVVSFERGMIPANLHFNNPNPNIKGLHNGKLEVVTKPIPVEGKYYAMNSFGFGGANGHILISPHNKMKIRQNESMSDGLPRLVTVSARTEEGLNCLLEDLRNNYKDFEYVRLYHEIFSDTIDGYFHTGYVILNQTGNHTTSRKITSNEKRPLWFIFSGMGSQWPAMGVSLMKIPIFAESVSRSHKVLQSKGVDLLKIITSNDPQIVTNILNSFVGIVAIQIGLVDVLKALGIEPDGIMGHSVGEIACAYADECLTAEQAILITYYYSLVSLEAEFIHSTMIVVGLGYNSLKNLTSPGIDIISHNSSESCTISGPTDIIQEFIEVLNERSISYHQIHTSNIANHSRFINSAPSKLLSHFKKIIAEPRLRSKKWLCTSALQNLGFTDELRYCSAHYFINNFTSPVYFEETYNHVPQNAVAIEIAPYGFLSDILERSQSSSVENIPLTTKNRDIAVEFFLNALGRLYETGHCLKLSNLYPSVEFPVSKSTPMISPLIKWRHSERWMNKAKDEISISTVRNMMINPKSSLYEHITGHIIDERNLYPGLGYLELIWDTVANMVKKEINTLPIVFENVRFQRATNVPKKGTIKFRITVHLGTNTFGITENEALIVSGKVRIPKNVDRELFDVEPFEDEISNSQILPLNTKDFYKELRLKGYHYKGLFKKVVYVNAEGTYGRVQWNNNFTTFMDTMAQVPALQTDCRQLVVPTFIRKLVIDVNKHYRILQTLEKESPEFPVNFYPELGLLSSGGVQMLGFRTNEIARRPGKADPVLEVHKFIPYISEEVMDLNLVVRLCVHIALENVPSIKVRTYELLDQEYSKEAVSISSGIAKSLADLPLIQASVNVLTQSQGINEDEYPQDVAISSEELPEDNSSLLVVLSDIQSKTEFFEKIFKALKRDGFIITRESRQKETSLKDLGFEACFSRLINENERIVLIRKINEKTFYRQAIKISNDSYSWITQIQNTLVAIKSEENEKFVVYAEKEPTSGVLGFANCLRKEEKGMTARCFYIEDETAPNFSLEHPFYKSQLEKNLSQNVFKKGQWGSYRHLPFEPVAKIETSSAFCSLEKRADLSSFRWFEDSIDLTRHEKVKKSLVHVYFSSLNFRDVMISVGRIAAVGHESEYRRFNEGYHGYEYSGKDENGQRIMGMVAAKGLATIVQKLPLFSWIVPDNMSLEEAATIPIVYCTVVYALFLKMTLKKKSSILIHAGAGGVGQAAINICLHYECNIFTTVGTPEKVEFIRKTYPQIPERHIGHSRDTSFEEMIMEQTNGKGVDIVLNSLSEEKLKASLRCVAKGGHFLEIGKFDMFQNNNIDMCHFLNDITFHSIQMDTIALKETHSSNSGLETSRQLQTKMQEMLDQGIIKPLNRTIYQSDEVESAFRYMAAGKHIGKVMIKLRDEDEDRKGKPVFIRIKAKPRVYCEENKSYVIVGGLGGFGLELADWLILRGARNIVLSSRTGVKNGYQSYRIKLWRSYGVNVVISTDDVTQEDGARHLIETANSSAPVAGIFNVALILKDDPFPKQNEEKFNTVAGPKAIATAHLDKLSRKLCPYLEHFVIFSSVSCGRGNLNQTNYGFANSVMERICELRNADNLPALAIQWGAIGEVGVVADFAEENLSIVIGGTLQQNVKSCLDSLNLFMKQPNPIVSSMIVAEKRHADSDVIGAVANILGIKDLKNISLTWTLPELGMDSILAVEIKQILEAEFNKFFTPEDLRTMTFAKLYQLKDEKKNSSKAEGEQTKRVYEKLSTDIKLIKEPIVCIPLENAEIRENFIDEKTPLFILPGVEGLASFVEPLTKNLSLPVFCFQYYQENIPLDSLPKAGEYFVEFILERLDSNQEFCIVGHSLGGLYALEVISILEQKGRKGYLWLLDSSPEFLTAMAEHYCNKNKSLRNEEVMQNYVCTQLIKSALPEMAREEYFSYIEKANNWESKKKIIFSMTSQYSINEELLDNVLEKIYGLSKIIQSYDFEYNSLETSCILIRPTENPYDLDDSYGLTQYFKNPVQVHKIEANHYNILENPKTADIILDCPVWKKT